MIASGMPVTPSPTIGDLTEPDPAGPPTLPVDFDPVVYLRFNPDVEAAGLDPEAHFLEWGWRENRRWTPGKAKNHNVDQTFSLQPDQDTGVSDSISATIAATDQAVPLLRSLNNFHVVCDIVSETKIGDSLCCLPLMLQLARIHKKSIYVQGRFSKLLHTMCADMPLIFDTPPSPNVIQYSVNVRKAYDLANMQNIHMAEAHFLLFDLKAPPAPIYLPLINAATDLPRGAIVAPFTASDEDHSKEWWPDRWGEVITHLLGRNDIDRVYVLGGPHDDATPYLSDRVLPIMGRSLDEVLTLLRESVVFISVDAGLSHLAHFGGVAQHVVMLPSHVAARLAENPLAERIVSQPDKITAQMVIDAVQRCLSRP